ncbi:hypothetical protein [Streptomyces xanthochromogenes]|uniref:hypothetical protein n=1 Tax=Streptomyces xanthochromogenes TaxID=67384 RepID=UPI0034155EC0
MPPAGLAGALGGTTADRWIGGPMGLAGTGLSARAGRAGGGVGGVARWTGAAGVGAAVWGPAPSPRTGIASGPAGVGGTGRCTAGAGLLLEPVGAGAGAAWGAEGAGGSPGPAVEGLAGGVAVRCTTGMPAAPGERVSSRPLFRTGRAVSPCGASGRAGDTGGAGAWAR